MENEQRGLIKIIGEEEYREKVKFTFSDLFVRQFYYELSSTNPSLLEPKEIAKRRRLFQKRLPVYIDALSRGYPQVLDMLRTDKINEEDPQGLATKEYTMRDGSVSWKIITNTVDPFELSDYYIDLELQGIKTQGESDILTEPFLAGQILDKGMDKQKIIYDNFISVYSLILDTELIAGSTLPYFYPEKKGNTPDQQEITAYNYFSLIKEAAHQINAREKPDEAAQQFIEQYVVTEDPLLNIFSQVKSYAQNIIKIHGIFRENNNQPVREHYRRKFEDTLVVELLTNPEAFADPQTFRTPATLRENAEKLSKFSEDLKISGRQDIALYKIGLVVNSLIEQNMGKLEQLFSGFGITPEIGVEWLQNLMFTKLKTMQEKGLDINFSDSFVPEKRQVEVEAKFNPDTFIKQLIKDNQFHKTQFSRISREERKSVIRKIFDSPHLLSKESHSKRISGQEYDAGKAGGKDISTYSKTLRKMLEALRISYSYDEKKFIAIQPETHVGSDTKQFGDTFFEWKWLAPTQRDFLETMRANLDRDRNLPDATEEAIASINFYYFLKAFDPPKKEKFRRIVANTNIDVRDHKYSQEDALKRIANAAASYILFQHYPKYDNNRQPVSFLADQVSAVIFNELERNNYLITDQAGYLRVMESIFARIQKIQDQFRHEYFSKDYSLDKTSFMKGMLDISISSLDFREPK